MKHIQPLVFIVIIMLTALSNAADGDRGTVVRIQSEYDGPTLHREFSTGTNHALIIGIDKYRHHPDLKTAVNDARGVAELLEKNYFFQRKNILFLKDEEATRNRITLALDDLLADKVKKGDNIFIYYAGHGWYHPGLKRGYWVTTEAKESHAAYLSNDLVYDYIISFDEKGVRHIFLVSDSCFSGSFLREYRSIDTNIDDRYFRQKYARKSRNILTSGGLEPVADGGKDGHSIFAYYFLKTLAENPHPYISVKQLGTEVEKMVTRNSGQTPIGRFIHGAGDEGGQFFFINIQSKKKRVEPDIAPGPSDVDISFDDIREAESRQREISEKWKKWQERRNGQFQEAEQYDKSEYLNAEQKKAVWDRFHAAVTENNPFSAKDEEMRSYAKDRISYWEKRKKKPSNGNTTGAVARISGAATTSPHETERDGSFIAYVDGTVKDTKTGLMWAAKDNGEDIGWKDAKKYCENFKGGGYTDWRLPSLDELEGLYDRKQAGYTPECCPDCSTFRITKLIHLTCFPWVSDTRGSEAGPFDFGIGSRYLDLQSISNSFRVLPVRGGK